MANEITKCPMCGTKLKMMNGQMTCKKCGYYIRNQATQSDIQGQDSASWQYGSAGQTGASGQYGSGTSQYTSGTASQYTSGTASQSASGRTGSASWQSGSSPQRNAEHNPTVGIAVAIVAGVACVALLAVIIIARSGGFSNMLPKPDSGSQANSSSSRYSDSSEDSGQSSSSAAGNKTANASMPTSSFFQLVAEYIWDKPCSSITAEEYASLTAIQINRDEKSITYQLDYGDAQTVTYQTDAGMALSDLSCFTGLEWISIDDDLQRGDLKGLNSLHGVY